MQIDPRTRGVQRHARVLQIVGQCDGAATLLHAYAHRLLMHGGLSAVVDSDCSEAERRAVLLDVARMVHHFRATALATRAVTADDADRAWCDRVLCGSAGAFHFAAGHHSGDAGDAAVYAVGASLTHLFHPQRLVPFHAARDAAELVDMLGDGDAAPEVYAVDGAPLRQLLEACLSPTPSERPSLDAVLDRLLELAVEIDGASAAQVAATNERERDARAEQVRLQAQALQSAAERAADIDGAVVARRAAEERERVELERAQREIEAQVLATQRALEAQQKAAAEAERRRILSSRCPSGQHGVGDYCYIISAIWR